jgi:hypothetical protein
MKDVVDACDGGDVIIMPVTRGVGSQIQTDALL